MTLPQFAPAALVTALCGLLAVFLTVRVIMNRVRTGVNAGDGGDAQLAQAIRAHANFVEHAPLALLLLLVSERLGTPALAIAIMGGVLLVARAANAWGLSHSLGPSMPRQAGAGLSLLTVTALSLSILYRVLFVH